MAKELYTNAFKMKIVKSELMTYIVGALIIFMDLVQSLTNFARVNKRQAKMT